MLSKELSVKVVASGYIELVECKDPQLCAQVLALLLKDARPETPEQRIIRELEDKVAIATGQTVDERARSARLEKQVADLQKKIETLATAARVPAPVQMDVL